jgi:hypothetical protein
MAEHNGEDGAVCPHCFGVLGGRWDHHSSGCPARTPDHQCQACQAAIDKFGSGAGQVP